MIWKLFENVCSHERMAYSVTSGVLIRGCFYVLQLLLEDLAALGWVRMVEPVPGDILAQGQPHHREHLRWLCPTNEQTA